MTRSYRGSWARFAFWTLTFGVPLTIVGCGAPPSGGEVRKLERGRQGVSVEAVLSGPDLYGRTQIETLFATHVISETGNHSGQRLHYIESAWSEETPIDKLTQLRLWVRESYGVPMEESYVFLSLSRSVPFLPEPLNEITNVPGWVKKHTGELGILRIEKDDQSFPDVLFSNFATPPEQRPAGAAWLARIEDDDRVLPFRRTPPPGDPVPASFEPMPLVQTRYLSPSGDSVDFFDVESLAGMLLANFAVDFSEGMFDESNESTKLNIENHQMHVIPHLPSSTGDPGVGFIYKARVTGSWNGIPGFDATVYVPLSAVFKLAENDGDYLLDIDLFGPSNSDFLDRVTIAPNNLTTLPGNMEKLRDSIVETLSNISTDLEGSLSYLLTLALEEQTNVVSLSDHSVIAVPEPSSTVSGLGSTLAISIKTVVVRELVLSPSGSTGVAGTTKVDVMNNGRLLVTKIKNDDGTIVRQFEIARPEIGTQFRIILLE